MNENSWTPGPWRYSKAHGDIISMARVKDDVVCDTESSSHGKRLVKDKDAALIASAPSMYDALSSAQGLLNPVSGFVNVKNDTKKEMYLEHVRHAIRQALASARGEHS